MKKNIWLIGVFSFVLQLAVLFNAAGQGEPAVKNVIFMVGDGMGVSHVTALMLNQEYEPINMERSHYVGLVKTYSANNRVTDSAAAATALATGTKTNNSYLGVDPSGNRLTSILEMSRNKGMKTGLVVTSDITNATPAGYYAHVRGRSDLEQIALHLYEADVDVWTGGGKLPFVEREDGRNLLDGLRDKGYTVVGTVAEMEAVTSGKVAGLLSEKGYMKSYSSRGDYLPQATAQAMRLLDNRNGFFLMVEGSQIDGGGHQNNIRTIINETRDFDNAVKEAFDFADANPGTLVVILADHETGGLSLASNDTDFTTSEKGIDYRFGTTSHTATMVPLFAYGTCASEFGRVLDNTDIFHILCRLMELN